MGNVWTELEWSDDRLADERNPTGTEIVLESDRTVSLGQEAGVALTCHDDHHSA